MLKMVIQVAFLFIGGALGLLFLPPLYEFINLSSNPWINNPYISVTLGATILFVLSFVLSDYCVRLITWLEDTLFKLPVGDLLFGTLGLIIGLSVAFLIGFGINRIEIPVVTDLVFGYVDHYFGVFRIPSRF